MTQCIQNSILQKKPDRTSEMTLLSGFFCGSLRQK